MRRARFLEIPALLQAAATQLALLLQEVSRLPLSTLRDQPDGFSL